MIDYDILTECGTTNERLREFFTAKLPGSEERSRMSEKEVKAVERDVKKRKEFEEMVSGWIQEQVMYSLANHKRISAVDLAWDSVPINKQIFPLIQYAQGRIDIGKAVTALKEVPDGGSYVKKNSSGEVIGIDLPKFTEMNINLVRSTITRRTAAQAVKYNELWPWFKYEPRSGTQVGKFRADCVSQRMDIMADQYNYRHDQTQVIREMFLYPFVVEVPRSSWEREVQWEKASRDPDTMYDTIDGKQTIKKRARVVREGLAWVRPHPSRVGWDNNYPLATFNTDTGCEYLFFWDVTRWGDVYDNPDYFNRDSVGYSADTAAWFTTYSSFFNQYYDRIVPPQLPENPGGGNDAKNHVGLYTGNMRDSACFFTNVWAKVIPRQWGWGSYPFPIWVHLKTAGDATVVYADIMPSSPAAVTAYNNHDGRLDNLSVAHELMQFQDQLTNLFSQLLECIKADLFSVAVLNRDVFPKTPEGEKVFDEFKKVMAGKNYFTSMQMLEASFEHLSQVLGREVTADMVFKVVRSSPNTAINDIFRAITQVINMADRLFVMSPHEQGQAASHEITASESNNMAGSTDTIYSFISTAIDEGRAAKKRICFESLIAKGSDDVELPVANRYPDSIIEKAGFKVTERDEDGSLVGYKTVTGAKHSLVHDYIFTTRDGGNRSSNVQAATVLTQLIQAIGTLQPAAQNAILSAMGKEKLFDLFNQIFRMADAGVDLNLELKPGETDELLLEDDQQVMGAIDQLAQALKQNTLDIQQLKAGAEQLMAANIPYKDAPPEIQRQMEMEAGYAPAGAVIPPQAALV